MNDDQAKKRIRVRSYKTGADGTGNHVEIENLTSTEAQLLLGSIQTGVNWVRRTTKGRLTHVPAFLRPKKEGDPEMFPFWRPASSLPPHTQLQMIDIDLEAATNTKSASIIIQHVCGYDYTEELYAKMSLALESYGFVQLRSKRDEQTGRYWELWFLPGVWMAKGALKEALTSTDKNEQIKQAQTFLSSSQNNIVTFGTLDTCVQRMAMVLD